MRIDSPPKLRNALRSAASIAVLTGAGVSAASGVPTFRDARTGLWARFRPEELATPGAFARDPQLVWDWYAWRRELVAQSAPNAAHRALARLQDLVGRFTLITQNVDGLHQRAGSREVIELHGNIHRNKCFAEGTVVDTAPLGKDVPRCPRCNSPLRPDVVWFGESLPPDALAAAEAAARSSDVFFSIGTSAAVFPAAELPVIALRSHATLIEINTEATPLTPMASFGFRGEAGAVLPALLAAVWGEQAEEGGDGGPLR